MSSGIKSLIKNGSAKIAATKKGAPRKGEHQQEDENGMRKKNFMLHKDVDDILQDAADKTERDWSPLVRMILTNVVKDRSLLNKLISTQV